MFGGATAEVALFWRSGFDVGFSISLVLSSKLEAPLMLWLNVLPVRGEERR
jgi:hypothetical protein